MWLLRLEDEDLRFAQFREFYARLIVVRLSIAYIEEKLNSFLVSKSQVFCFYRKLSKIQNN